MKRNKAISISGKVIYHNTQKGAQNLRIEAWNKRGKSNNPISSDVTDSNGLFNIEFEESRFGGDPSDIFLKVFNKERFVHSTENRKLWHALGNVGFGSTRGIVIEVETDRKGALKTTYTDKMELEPLKVETDYPICLFPVKLETHFVSSESGAILKVRIIPDTLVIDTHEPELTENEEKRGYDFWQIENKKFAWEQLAKSFGKERAAWIAQATNPKNPQKLQPRKGTWTRAAYAKVLPTRWVAVGYKDGKRVVTELGEKISSNKIPDLLPAGPSPDKALQDIQWAVDFNEAVKCGMGLQIPLTKDQADAGLDLLVVFGVKELDSQASAERLKELLNAQHYTQGLSFVLQGTPTNNTPDAPSGYILRDPDYETRYNVEMGKFSFGQGDGSNGDIASRAFGIAPNVFSNIQYANEMEQIDARYMNTALWSIGGYFLEQMMAHTFSEDIIRKGRKHFINYVRGRGPLPALRVGTQPYGVLPVTSLDRWVTLDLQSNPKANDFAYYLRLLREIWRDSVKCVPAVSNLSQLDGEDCPDFEKDNIADNVLFSILGMSPIATGYTARSILGSEYTAFYWKYAFTKEKDELGLGADWWKEQEKETMKILDKLGLTWNPRLARASFANYHFLLNGPLVQAGELSKKENLNPNYIEWLLKSDYKKIRDEIRDEIDIPGGKTPDTLLYLLLRHATMLEYSNASFRILHELRYIRLLDRFEPELVDLGNEFFNWDILGVPLSSDNERFKEFLIKTYGLSWVSTAEIEKRGPDEITVGPLLLYLYDGRTKGKLIIEGGVITDDFTVRTTEKGKTYIYRNTSTVWDQLEKKFDELIVSGDQPPTIGELLDRLKGIIKNNKYKVPWDIPPGYWSWDKIPGEDELGFKSFLINIFDINWVKAANVQKIDNDRTIKVFTEKNYLLLTLNDEKTKATKANLKIDDGRTDEFIIKIKEKGKAYLCPYPPVLIEYIAEFGEFWKSLDYLSSRPTEVLKQLTTETLDLFSHRLDAWITSLAAERLDELRQNKPTGIYLGAYGFVENLKQEPAHSSDGFVHAPSIAHASTAAVLLSGYLSHGRKGENGNNPLAIDLSSERVRLALWLLDGVRQGQQLEAILGYRFERSLHKSNLDKYIDNFRKLAPFAGINVVNGLALHKRWKDGKSQNKWDNNTIPFGDSEWGLPGTGPDYDQLNYNLSNLDDAVDAVSDILIAESVYHMVQGNPLRSGATLEAISKRESPPQEIEVVRTPRTGIGITHRILVLFSGDSTYPSAWATNDYQARAYAEPHLNAWAAQLLGDPKKVRCRAQYLIPKVTDPLNPKQDEILGTREISLNELELSPLDALYIAEGHNTAQRSELEQRIIYYLMKPQIRKDISADANVRLIFARGSDWSTEDVSFAEFLEVAHTVRKLITGARAIEVRDLSLPEEAGEAINKSKDAEELKERFDKAIEALKKTQELLENNEVAKLRESLFRAAYFGVQSAIPLSYDDMKILSVQAESVKKEVKKRIDKAQSSSDLHDIFGADFLVLPRFTPKNIEILDKAFKSSTSLQGNDPNAVITWFQRIARVRDRIVPFETSLLYAEALGNGATLKFKVGQLPYQEDDRWAAIPFLPNKPIKSGRLSLVAQLVNVPEDSQLAGPLAGLFIDEWTEIVPNASETTGVAFHYNQPNACAPQAILLAVPPDKRNKLWDYDTLEAIILETLDLAKLRAVSPDLLRDVGHFLPALYFSINRSNDTVSTDFMSVANKPDGGQ